MSEPYWIAIARRHLGLAETPGRETTPVIRRWLISLNAWWTDDETPWCGTYCAAVMREAGLMVPKHWYRARAWLDWGLPLDAPVPGCLVIYARSGGGHVGFIVGRDQLDRLLTLGGNQGNRVSIAPFARERVLGYRWPVEIPPMNNTLPTFAHGGSVSNNEA